MSEKTTIEITLDNRLLTDIEERAENEGTDVQTLITCLCAIAVKS